MTKGERIKKRREELGISQRDLAQMAGTYSQNLYKYEQNIITNIPSDKIEAIAAALHVSPAYIMGWEEKETPTAQDDGHSPVALQFAEEFSDLTAEEWNQVANYANFLRSQRTDTKPK